MQKGTYGEIGGGLHRRRAAARGGLYRNWVMFVRVLFGVLPHSLKQKSMKTVFCSSEAESRSIVEIL
jgi:hypothetical protein